MKVIDGAGWYEADCLGISDSKRYAIGQLPSGRWVVLDEDNHEYDEFTEDGLCVADSRYRLTKRAAPPKRYRAMRPEEAAGAFICPLKWTGDERRYKIDAVWERFVLLKTDQDEKRVATYDDLLAKATWVIDGTPCGIEADD